MQCTISVFSLDLWKGKVLCTCIRPSLAIGAHWHTYTVRWVIQLDYVGGGGGGEGRQCCRYAAVQVCVVEICRSYTCRLFSESLHAVTF